MPKSNRKKISPKQIPMEGFEPPETQPHESKNRATKEAKKLLPDLQKLGLRKSEEELFEAIPELSIKTRWERLEKAIDKQTHIKTIIRPVPDAIEMISRLIMSVRSTNDCKIVVVKADSGMGKTTFLNTLDLYLSDNQGVNLKIQTIDIAMLKTAEDYLDELRKREIAENAVNIIILEGRETPGDITREFIDGVISKTTRFSRMHNQPMLVVVPTNEDSVARTWVSVAAKTGGLAPTGLPGGQQWYDFPGVPKEKYIEIAEETVRVLNQSQSITDFGITISEMSNLVDMSDTIGQYLEGLMDRNTKIRNTTRRRLEKRAKVLVVYCCPDRTAYDQLFTRIDALVLDEYFHVSPAKLVSSTDDNEHTRKYDDPLEWAKLLNTVNFLDFRLVNLPIVTLINAALAYGDKDLLTSFKTTTLRQFQDKIPEEMWRRDERIQTQRKDKTFPDDFNDENDSSFDWDEPLNRRKRQSDNVLASLRSSNLFFLLRGQPALAQKGGNKESTKQLAQFFHLMEKASIPDLHRYIGKGLEELLTTENFPGYLTRGTETPYIQGKKAPVPDVTIYTEQCDYLLEFHFSRRSLATSEIARYAIRSVLEKYMAELPILKSFLDKIE